MKYFKNLKFFSKALDQFYFGFVYRVAVKCSDVSEGRTALLVRANKLPTLDAPLFGGNI